jgi:hypothetical protein
MTLMKKSVKKKNKRSLSCDPARKPDISRSSNPEDELDEHLVLIVLTNFHRLRQALVQVGYSRVSGVSRHTQADWFSFARRIGFPIEPGATGDAWPHSPASGKERGEHAAIAASGGRGSLQTTLKSTATAIKVITIKR